MSTRSNRSTPRKRRAARSRRSPKYTSRRTEEVTPRRRIKSSPRYRSSKSSPRYRSSKPKSSSRYNRESSTPQSSKFKSSSRYNREKSTPKDGRSSRPQSYSPQYRGYDDDCKEELCTSDNERRRERATSHPSRVEKSQSSSKRDDVRGRYRKDSDSWSKECKASEVWPECRLRDIEASGGSRDFGKWFGKVPPNCRVDKDVRTDRGTFRKDNFESSFALDRYLGINGSKSPSKRRRRRSRVEWKMGWIIALYSIFLYWGRICSSHKLVKINPDCFFMEGESIPTWGLWRKVLPIVLYICRWVVLHVEVAVSFI